MSSVAEKPDSIASIDRSTPAKPRRLRVGFVMHVMQVAGAEVLVKQIIEQLSAEIEPTIFCLDSLGELGAQLREAGVPVVVFNRQPGLDWKLPGRMATEIEQRGIEVLHAHQYTPFFYSALARLRGARQVRILLTEHGRHYPDIVSRKRRLANRWLLSRLADMSTACCDFSARALETNDGFRHVITVPNGVDLTHLPARGTNAEQADLRRSLHLEVDRPYVACVARFHPIKDHQMLIRGWQHVNRELPEARLLLVGDGPERNACEQLAKELKIADSIEYWGIRHDVAEILRAVNAFALTSVSEAASLTLLEAMASECPVVVTDVGGNGEHVTNGKHGYLVPRGDYDALGQRLLSLLRDSACGKSFGIDARKHVIDNFDLRQSLDRYAQLYQEISNH